MAKICSNCGTQCADSFTSCFTCGAKIESTQPQQQKEPTYEQQSYQQSYQQPVYQQPSYQQPLYSQIDETVSVGAWVGNMILLSIPVVNIIMLIVWACSSTKRSLKNFAIAQFVLALIGVGIFIVLMIIFAIMGISLGSMYNY